MRAIGCKVNLRTEKRLVPATVVGHLILEGEPKYVIDLWCGFYNHQEDIFIKRMIVDADNLEVMPLRKVE
jgi:hypothetical protein